MVVVCWMRGRGGCFGGLEFGHALSLSIWIIPFEGSFANRQKKQKGNLKTQKNKQGRNGNPFFLLDLFNLTAKFAIIANCMVFTYKIEILVFF